MMNPALRCNHIYITCEKPRLGSAALNMRKRAKSFPIFGNNETVIRYYVQSWEIYVAAMRRGSPPLTFVEYSGFFHAKMETPCETFGSSSTWREVGNVFDVSNGFRKF